MEKQDRHYFCHGCTGSWMPKTNLFVSLHKNKFTHIKKNVKHYTNPELEAFVALIASILNLFAISLNSLNFLE